MPLVSSPYRSCFYISFMTQNWHPGAILASLTLGKGIRSGKDLFSSMFPCLYPLLVSDLSLLFLPLSIFILKRQSLLLAIFATALSCMFCLASRDVASLCKLAETFPAASLAPDRYSKGFKKDHIRAKVFEHKIMAYNLSVRQPLPCPCHKSPDHSV